jgi:S-layer protein (TIGR01564 family)
MNATRIKKAGKAVAGSALLVGATLTGAAGLAAAQDSGSSGEDSGDLSLADYPTPFVGEDGTVNTAVVVGEQAATIDVVGAINIAGSLGNQAFTTEQVSAEGGSFGFSATQGVTLTTANDDLYYGDSLNEVRDTHPDSGSA